MRLHLTFALVFNVFLLPRKPALLLFEYFLTLDDELDLIWRSNMSPSSWLFLANRVVFILFMVGTVTTYYNVTVSRP